MEQVYDLAGAIEPRFRTLVLLAAFCGLRKSEGLGLARRHVDLGDPYPRVIVERQRIEVAGKGLVFSEPKTKAARRAVAIPASLIDEIVLHLDRYVDGDPDSLLFTLESTGDVPRSSSWTRIWNHARGQSGLPSMRFHDLRHLAGTLAAIAGGTLKEIQARLGHASPDAAMIYQHVAEGRDGQLATGIDQLIGRRDDP